MSFLSTDSLQSCPFLLDGKWVSEGRPFEIRSPYDNSVVGSTFEATRGHLDLAIQAAARSFEETRQLPAYERQRILRRVAEGIAEHADEFARVMALEAGKPMKAARAEVERAVFTFSIAAEESTRITGDWLPMDLQQSAGGRWGIVRRFPLGPIVAITPFNFPLNLVAHKLAPAMATGCTIVLKPAPKTPFLALRLSELIDRAGWPAGALNTLNLTNEDAEELVRDDRLKLLTFTGSGGVGWALKAKAGKKRVLLELGGNAAVIVHADADVEYAAERCVLGGYSYSGQSCISVQRLFVHRSIKERFMGEFLERVNKLRMGDPLEPSTDVGPMIHESAARRVEKWIREATDGGAEVLAGGTRNQAFFTPTVLTHTSAKMRVNCEEIFGPVVVIETYDEFTKVLRQVNESPYGLQAGLFTRDAKLIFQAYEALEVGGLIVNDMSSFRMDHTPYGGWKDSGLGREGVRCAMEEMTATKLLVMNSR